MSLPRTSSINIPTDFNQKNNIQKNEGEENSDISNAIDASTINSAQSMDKKSPRKNVPEMRLKSSSDVNQNDLNKKELSPGAIPRSVFLLKSPGKLKEKSVTATDQNLFEEKPYSHESVTAEVSPEIEKGYEKNSLSSTKIISADANDFPSTSPVLQIRRHSVAFPAKLLNEENVGHTPTATTSPRSKNLASSLATGLNPEVMATDIHTSVQIASEALVKLILKEYENKPLNPEMIKVLGRDDIYFPVVRLPKILTHLCDFPDKGLTSISELLVALFGKELTGCSAWKKADAAITRGLSLEDGTVQFGENNTEVKRKYCALIKPLANTIADSILGADGKMNTSSLPVDFVNLLYQGDKKLLEICLDSKKLRVKDINNARLYFMFNLVVTRFLQVLIMKKFPDMPTQVESWLMSEILSSFGAGITTLFQDFMIQSGGKIPAGLIAKFDAKAAAEIREDEAIKKFKQKQLTQSRINELKQIDSRRTPARNSGHHRATSNIDLAGMKFERDNKKKLDTIKSECGFDEMDDKFIHFIEKNQKIWFHADEKNTLSHILLSLKVAVREYLEVETPEKSLVDGKFQVIFQNLDARLSAEHEVKRKRRTTTYSKDIEFSVNMNNGSESKGATVPASTSTSSFSPIAASTSDIIPTSTDSNFSYLENNLSSNPDS